MAISTREGFKEYCLRRLGYPVLDINVDDDQVEDRIDDALQYYQDYHFDGSEADFLAHQVTATDKENKYIAINDSDIIGVVDLFDIGDAGSGSASSTLFNIQYQIFLQEFYNYSSVNAAPYYMTKQHIALLEEVFVGKQPLRFNRHKNRVYIDMDWSKVNTGDYIVMKVYRALNPDTWTDVWNDRWLKEYATQLIKRQWGQNMSKFTGMQLPGGVQVDGLKILDDAQTKIDELEDEMITSYSPILSDMLG